MSWDFVIAAVISAVLTRAYIEVSRSEWWARRRAEHWRYREIEARRAMLEAIDRGDREAEREAERRVTLASARHIKWKRRV